MVQLRSGISLRPRSGRLGNDRRSIHRHDRDVGLHVNVRGNDTFEIVDAMDCANSCGHGGDSGDILGGAGGPMTLPKQIPPCARVIASTTLIIFALLAFKWCTG